MLAPDFIPCIPTKPYHSRWPMSQCLFPYPGHDSRLSLWDIQRGLRRAFVRKVRVVGLVMSALLWQLQIPTYPVFHSLPFIQSVTFNMQNARSGIESVDQTYFVIRQDIFCDWSVFLLPIGTRSSYSHYSKHDNCDHFLVDKPKYSMRLKPPMALLPTRRQNTSF